MNPGSYHYYIHHVGDSEKIADEEKQLISETNFNVYNLITLFLTSIEIKALLKLINSEQVNNQEFIRFGESADVVLKYIYYLTGPLGVGKSTTTNLLRSLHVLDEWKDARPANLAVPPEQLDSSELSEADKWIANQFYEKNNTLLDLEPSISIVDRPPLDPLAFTKINDRPLKARQLRSTICPEGTSWRIVSGVVILLTGDPSVLSARVRATGREKYTSKLIDEMQQDQCKIYSDECIYKIDTKNMTVLEVTKKVAEIIHRKAYQPFDLMGELLKYERNDHGK